jgi:hypothetical protein
LVEGKSRVPDHARRPWQRKRVEILSPDSLRRIRRNQIFLPRRMADTGPCTGCSTSVTNSLLRCIGGDAEKIELGDNVEAKIQLRLLQAMGSSRRSMRLVRTAPAR